MPAGATDTVPAEWPTEAAVPGTSHHAGGVMLCRPAWRVPWLAPIRVLGLVVLAAVAKALADIHVGGSSVHTVATVTQWPALGFAAYVALHPFLLRWQFRGVRAGTPVDVRWAGRDRSGQPWLVLRSPEGRMWRTLPRQGPVEYPLPRWRGTPWLYPPGLDAVSVHGTLVRPRWTWRRGLVMHRPDDGQEVTLVGGREVLAFGTAPAGCLGVHIQAVRRLRGRGRGRGLAAGRTPKASPLPIPRRLLVFATDFSAVTE